MDENNKKNVTLDDMAATMADGFVKVNENHESLARMVAKGFDRVDGRFDKIEGRLGGVEGRLDKLETTMEALRSSVNNYLELSTKGISSLRPGRA
jgi:hypothetical protein